MASEVNQLLDELQERIEKLKISYEQYFMGIEKREPMTDRRDLTRLVRKLQYSNVTNTGLRFRLKSLQGRFTSYQNYWNRILRQIEAGTYIRDLARIERDAKARGVEINLTKGGQTKGELEAELLKALKKETEGGAAAPDGGIPAGPPTHGAPPPIPGSAASDEANPAMHRMPAAPDAKPGGDADAGLRQLYDSYVNAKQQTGESTKSLSFEKLKRSIDKQVPAIKQKTGAASVDFRVEIRDGKAILKAVPKH